MATKTQARWDTLAFQRIRRVDHAGQGDQLSVLFEDGSRVIVAAEQLLPAHIRGADWTTLTYSPFEIVVDTVNGPCEIPWDTIRVLTDREFSAHRAAAAEDEARLVGQKIRALRKRRHLSSKELAERAGITPHSLSRIELGRHDVVLTTLERILAAMGCSFNDLVEGGGS